MTKTSADPDPVSAYVCTPDMAERIICRLALALIQRFTAKALRHVPPPSPEARAAIARLGKIAEDFDIALCMSDHSLRDILEEGLPRLAEAFTAADAANIVPDDIVSFLFDNERPW